MPQNFSFPAWLYLVEFYIQWCGALKWTHWRSYLKQLICSCLTSYFSGKATKVGSPPNFPKLISHLWGTLQPQYFVTLFLDPYWTYLWKYFIYYKKETKVVSQHFVYQIWFCTRLLSEEFNVKVVVHQGSCLSPLLIITVLEAVVAIGAGYYPGSFHPCKFIANNLKIGYPYYVDEIFEDWVRFQIYFIYGYLIFKKVPG